MKNILGKIEESKAGVGSVDMAGLKKIVRLSIIASGAGVVGVLLMQVPGLDLIPTSNVDETIITLFLVPLLEALRRYLADYQKSA